LTGASPPGIGDILFYQRRGSERARLTRRTRRPSAVREGNTIKPMLIQVNIDPPENT